MAVAARALAGAGADAPGGSRNEDGARLAATLWTVTATAEMAELNVPNYILLRGPQRDRLSGRLDPEVLHAHGV